MGKVENLDKWDKSGRIISHEFIWINYDTGEDSSQWKDKNGKKVFWIDSRAPI